MRFDRLGRLPGTPGQRELSVEVDHLARSVGKVLVVRVNGVVWGSMVVAGDGSAQLDRSTNVGQRVPVIGHGSLVTVRTAGFRLVGYARF